MDRMIFASLRTKKKQNTKHSNSNVNIFNVIQFRKMKVNFDDLYDNLPHTMIMMQLN